MRRLLLVTLALLLLSFPTFAQDEEPTDYEIAVQDIQRSIENETPTLNFHRRDFSMDEVPPEIGQATHLETLVLSGNNLSYIPPEIAQLSNLRELELGLNQFIEIPPEVFTLTELRGLGLSNTELVKLSPDIGNLINLEILHLSGTHIVELPDEIGQLTNLKELYLSGNNIRSLPSTFDQLVNLEVLSLENNNLPEPLQSIANRGSSDLLAYLENPFWYQWQTVIVGGGVLVLGIITILIFMRRRSRFNNK